MCELVDFDLKKKSRSARDSGMKKHKKKHKSHNQHKKLKKQKSQTCSSTAANSCPNGLNPYDISNIDITLRFVFSLKLPHDFLIGSLENQ